MRPPKLVPAAMGAGAVTTPTVIDAAPASPGREASPCPESVLCYLPESAASRRSKAARLWPLALLLSLLIHGALLLAAPWVNWLFPVAAVPIVPTVQVFELTPSPSTGTEGAQPGPATGASAAPSSEQQADAPEPSTAPATPIAEPRPPATSGSNAVAERSEASPPALAPSPIAPEQPPAIAAELAPAAPVAPPKVEPSPPPPAPSKRVAQARSSEATPAQRAANRPPPAPRDAPATASPPRGLTARDAETAASPPQADAPQQETRTQQRGEDRSGLAALDAEIAAARARTPVTSSPPGAPVVTSKARRQADAAPSKPALTKPLSGLAALDAEIAADRNRNQRGAEDSSERTNAASSRTERPSASRAAPSRSGTGASGSAAASGRDTGAVDSAAKRREEGRYLAALRRAIERHRHYPESARRRRLEGTARVQFTIGANGRFSAIRISRSAGNSELDEAATAAIRRLGRFEPLPPAIGRNRWTLRVPIVFRLN